MTLHKPFNPTIGETFQAKIGQTNYYVEQTSHHPPIYNYYVLGQGFKIYGHHYPDASTGANSVEMVYKGKEIIEFNDKTKIELKFNDAVITGITIGQRKLKFMGSVQVIDRANDLIAHVSMDTDDRSFVGKMFSRKTTNPDFIK